MIHYIRTRHVAAAIDIKPLCHSPFLSSLNLSQRQCMREHLVAFAVMTISPPPPIEQNICPPTLLDFKVLHLKKKNIK
jgi:hypothetical protein